MNIMSICPKCGGGNVGFDSRIDRVGDWKCQDCGYIHLSEELKLETKTSFGWDKFAVSPKIDDLVIAKGYIEVLEAKIKAFEKIAEVMPSGNREYIARIKTRS